MLRLGNICCFTKCLVAFSFSNICVRTNYASENKCAPSPWVGFSQFVLKQFREKQRCQNFVAASIGGKKKVGSVQLLLFFGLFNLIEAECCILKSHSLPLDFLWDRVVFMASLSALLMAISMGFSFLACKEIGQS